MPEQIIRPQQSENEAGDPDFLTGPGEGAATDSPATGRGPAEESMLEHEDTRQGNNYTAHPDSGFFGVGSNEGEGNDNLERETTPGYQSDKGDRGTIMPH